MCHELQIYWLMEFYLYVQIIHPVKPPLEAYRVHLMSASVSPAVTLCYVCVKSISCWLWLCIVMQSTLRVDVGGLRPEVGTGSRDSMDCRVCQFLTELCRIVKREREWEGLYELQTWYTDGTRRRPVSSTSAVTSRVQRSRSQGHVVRLTVVAPYVENEMSQKHRNW